MDRYEIDTVVIGAGVVGLACARALALAGHDVLVVEKNAVYGEETSARNSEVIHAGIYYDAGSLKAQWCVEGRRALYAYAEARGVAHRKCGKLIVAADDSELPMLETVTAKAAANGVENMRLLSRAEALAMEPALDVAGALLSPETGIVDSHALMLAYLGEAETHGAQLVTGAQVEGGALRDDGRIDLRVGGDEPLLLTAHHVVNAAGLWAQTVANQIDGIDAIPPLALAKGNYFALTCRAPFTRLIYPAPVGGGLGVHLTLDMQGRAKFGPDVEWLNNSDPATLDYSVDPARGDSFYAAIRRYWPGLPDGSLSADYSGVRPKIAGAEYPDYVLQSPAPGHVMLYGIESPGLTSSLAIADAVVAALNPSR
jgi:L-2-hydroxyglutarate oxidase LhgO